MKAIILAGGRGTRLAPYTTILPKPLMPLGEKPVLELLIERIKQSGIDEIVLAVGYLAELIMSYFGDGSKYGVKLFYQKEDKPLGTAGPIAGIRDLNETFLVVNGDILTTLDFKELLAFHKNKKALGTIALHKRQTKIDYGLIELNDNNRIVTYTEKPIIDHLVSMGIYVFEPNILDFMRDNTKQDIPDLIKEVIAKNGVVCGYVSEDYWLDIGRSSDYEQALRDLDNLK